MKIFNKKKVKQSSQIAKTVSKIEPNFFKDSEEIANNSVYAALRCSVPIIDSALNKIVRLTNGFKIVTNDKHMQDQMDYFCSNVPVGLCNSSIYSFVDCYLNSLLTFGNACGEIVVDKNGIGIAGLYNASLDYLDVEENPSVPFEKQFFICSGNKKIKVPHSERILFSALNPPPGKKYGVPLLRGLPYFSDILMRIYECIGQNYDRIGNVRYAVTYNPTNNPDDLAYAGERIEQIAKEWQEGMTASRSGEVRDFVSSGNVDIKVIGADNPLIDTEIPVRQLLEQIIAKLGIPPFMLGLSWSTTERMSSQQADMLTSELENYRRILTPVILKIADAFLRLSGNSSGAALEWDNINLQDEVELAQARKTNAEAEEIELRIND